MKIIKKTAFVLFLFMMVSIAYSQQGGGQRQRMSPEDRAKNEVEWMTKELKLTDKEAKNVEGISLKYAKKQQTEMEKARESGDREAMRSVMTKLNEERNKELKPVLGEKKYKKYLEILEERRQSRSQGRPRG